MSPAPNKSSPHPSSPARFSAEAEGSPPPSASAPAGAQSIRESPASRCSATGRRAVSTLAPSFRLHQIPTFPHFRGTVTF